MSLSKEEKRKLKQQVKDAEKQQALQGKDLRSFSDVGMDFSLFNGPIAHASTYGAGCCEICDEEVDLLFNDRCYKCVVSLQGSPVVDTEFGMVTLEEAEQGRTHGVPSTNPDVDFSGFDISTVPVDPNFPDSKWYHVHFAKEDLVELLKNPVYTTWQGEVWLFCCKKPMIFSGAIPSELLEWCDDNQTVVLRSLERFMESPDWEKTFVGNYSGHTVYAFSCQCCGRHRYNYDCH